MKIGDLIISVMPTTIQGLLAIVIEPYDAPKKLWNVYWLSEGYTSLCHENNVEVINESW